MRKIFYNEEKILIDEGAFFAKGVFETILCNEEPIFLSQHIKKYKHIAIAINASKGIIILKINNCFMSKYTSLKRCYYLIFDDTYYIESEIKSLFN